MSPELLVLILVLLPMAWTIIMAVTRRLFYASGQLLDDGAEKRQLLILVAPVVVGALFLVVAPLARIDVPLPQLPMTDFGAGDATIAPAIPLGIPAAPAIDLVRCAALGALLIYGALAVAFAVRLIVAQVQLSRMAGRTQPAPGFGAEVRLAGQDLPPLVWGRSIVLPRKLLTVFDAGRIDLVLRHERAHLSRGDGQWFAVLAWLDVVFWFNPLVRAQSRRCRLAAELACDAAVLRSAPEMRRVYAETLVATLKHTAGNILSISTQSGVPAVFSPDRSGDYRMRLREIMHPPKAMRKPGLVLGLAAAVLAVPLALGQYAWSQGAEVAAPEVVHLSVAPIDGPINSGFGDRLNPVTHKPAFHSGIDYKAALGTPVKAAGDGVVSNVDYQKYGMGWTVEINHGGGVKTRYAHLNPGVKVKTGDQVKAGDVIAEAGNSGVTTGPHLHFEVWQDDKVIDPAIALKLGGVDAAQVVGDGTRVIGSGSTVAVGRIAG